MRQTILIPTDGRIESLTTLRIALQEVESQEVNVVLLYAEHLNESISDLLFYSAAKRLQAVISPEFREALSIIRNRYEATIKSMNIEIFHGTNLSAFENYAAARKISAAFIPAPKSLRPSGNGFDPSSMIRKSGIPQREVAWAGDTYFNLTAPALSLSFK